MRPMTDKDRKKLYWHSQKQWWYVDDENEKIVFKPGTPKDVIESFNLWRKK